MSFGEIHKVGKKFYKAIALFLSLNVLTACAPTSLFSSGIASLDVTSQERGLGGYISDSEIQMRVNVVFFEHSHELYYLINANVYEGRVLLTGCLKDIQMQEDAVRLAWQVPGVKTVINETTVKTVRSFSEYAQDKWISTRLHSMIFLTSGVSSRNYEIIVARRVVYLVGVAKDQQELDLVIDLCRKVNGVEKIVSYVRLMDAYELRRRHLFNQRKVLSPLTQTKKEKEDKMRNRSALQPYRPMDPSSLPALERVKT